MRHDIIQVISLLLVATAVLLTQNAEAHPPRARQAHTIIETLNRDQRTLIVSYAKGRGPHELIWNSETMFLRDRKFVTATELKEGTHAVIYYHSPFFGKPFLTKVIWTNDESTNSSAIGHWNYTRGELRISTTRMGKQFAIIVRAFAGNTGA